MFSNVFNFVENIQRQTFENAQLCIAAFLSIKILDDSFSALAEVCTQGVFLVHHCKHLAAGVNNVVLMTSSTCISCSNGYLSAYLRGQDITTTAADRRFCGQTLPGPLVTTNPRLLLIFNTSDARYSGRGFSARYQFVTSM